MNIVLQSLQGHLGYMKQVADELKAEPNNDSYRKGYAEASAKWLDILLRHLIDECPMTKTPGQTPGSGSGSGDQCSTNE